MDFIKRVTLTALSLSIVAAWALAVIGPLTVSRDRFDYTAAISDSWKNQMLFNMVKIRYGDAPVFLDVSSVISQYQIAGAINLGATMSQGPWNSPYIPRSTETIGAAGSYVDRPTITYTPILGDKFARSLMSPIPPAVPSALSRPGIRWTLFSACWSTRLTGSGIDMEGKRGPNPLIPSFHSCSRRCGRSSWRVVSGCASQK